MRVIEIVRHESDVASGATRNERNRPEHADPPSVDYQSKPIQVCFRIELDLSPDLPQIPAYGAELSQVFINLIVNAADAIAERKENEPELEGKITISTVENGETVEIRVKDNGTGMSEDVRSKVFNQFFTTKDVGKGTGMGLSLTYNIVSSKHNGTVRVESEPNVGSSFIVILPMDSHQSVADESDVNKSDTCRVPILN